MTHSGHMDHSPGGGASLAGIASVVSPGLRWVKRGAFSLRERDSRSLRSRAASRPHDTFCPGTRLDGGMLLESIYGLNRLSVRSDICHISRPHSSRLLLYALTYPLQSMDNDTGSTVSLLTPLYHQLKGFISQYLINAATPHFFSTSSKLSG